MGPIPDIPARGSSRDDFDQYVHALIDLHTKGVLSEAQTRQRIAEVLYVCGVVENVAAQSRRLSDQDRLDLAENLRDLVCRKIIDGYYSLVRGRNESFCGWTRALAHGATASVLRNARRDVRHHGYATDPPDMDLRGYTDDVYSASVNGRIAGYMEHYTSQVTGMRDADRRLASANVLCDAFQLPLALRPLHMTDRDRLTRALNEDESLAAESLRACLKVRSGEQVSGPAADSALQSLWDDYTTDDIMDVLGKGSHCAHAIALAAVAPRPRPPKKTVAKFRTRVMAVGDQGWRPLAATLVDAYVASEYEAVSAYAVMSADAVAAATKGHLINRSRLDTLLAAAVQHPGAPLGVTRDDVLVRLGRLAARHLYAERLAAIAS